MGLVVEIFPAATSDSSLVTSLYSTSSFFGVVIDLDGRSEADLILRDIVHVDHGQFGQTLAQLAQTRALTNSWRCLAM